MAIKFERNTILILLVLALVVGALVCIAYFVRQNAIREDSALAQIQEGETLPYTDLEGNIFDLEQYRGSILVVNSWASWSPFSQDELRMLSELSSRDDKIRVVAINRMEAPENAKAYIEHIGNPSGITFLIDQGDEFYELIGGYAMPETVIYDKKGNQVVHHQGTLTREKLDEYIKAASESD